MLRAPLILSLLVGLSACASLRQDVPVEKAAEDQPAVAQGPVSKASELAENLSERSKPVLYRGSDKLIKTPRGLPPISVLGDDVSLNFEQAPLMEVVHAILGDILGLDYILSNPVSGQVTLRTRTPIPRSQLLGVLESLLKANNSLLVRGEGERFYVTSAAAGTKLAPVLSSAGDISAGFSTLVVPLQYISAISMADILRPVADESAFVRIDSARNLLMLAGTQEQLQGWQQMISTFDVDMLKGMSVGVFPLENSSAEEVLPALQGLLGSGGEGAGELGLLQLVRLIPLSRLNSILVVTPRAHYLAEMGKWIERLDSAPDSHFEKRLHVYPVQNSSATRLAELLNAIYAGGGTSSGAGQSGGVGNNQSGGLAPGLQPETVSGTGTGGSGGGLKAGSAFGSNNSAGSGAQTANKQYMLEDVRVVADEDNNSLMIYASGKDYRKIAKALQQLDVVPTQVIIEASIIEVTLTDELKYGLEWSFRAGLGSSYTAAGKLSTAATIPTAVKGFSYAVSNGSGQISALLSALSKQSLLNVISTPSVMVLDNKTAYIHVGDQVPVQGTQTVSSNAVITNSVTYRDTGVKLSVRPSVNAGGLVTMDIEQSVTDLGEIDSATGQRAFLERNISSRVAVRSSEAVVLGGLIRENVTDGSSGVPGLHSVPVLGALFGTKSDTTKRTELLVIITPKVVYNEQELRDVSREMRERMRGLELISVPAPLTGEAAKAGDD